MRTNKLILFASLLFIGLGLSSCGEDENTVEEYPNWQVKNETFYKNLTDSVKQLIANGNEDWKFFKTWSKDDSIKGKLGDSICVHVLTAGTGSGCPLYNDSVRVHYLGRLLPSTSYPEGNIIAQSYYGTYNPETSVPNAFLVSELIDGFTTAVMKMHIGDRWVVYIPYDLGYGSSTSSSVPAYSTLIYDITLAAYYHVGVELPVWSAKQGIWTDE
jgi:FKBP-type peptidyl-prolyl cis-trans isomerase FklB